MKTKTTKINLIDRFYLISSKLGNKIISFINSYCEKLISYNKWALSKKAKFIDVIYKWSCLLVSNITKDIIEVYNDIIIRFYEIARFTTIPLNKIWIFGWIYSIKRGHEGGELLDVDGVHYISALPGGGKSSLMYAKVKDYARQTAKASYITTMMEKPKWDSEGRYVNHRYFTLKEFYQDGEQIKTFNTKYFNNLIVDEFHLLNNNRKNKEKAYNAVFLPFINSLVVMRHMGIKKVLISSQMYKNDSQLMQLIKYYHQVKVRKGFDYKGWLKTGKFKFTILGWYITSFTATQENNGFTLQKVKTWYKKCNPEYLVDFETLSMKNIHKGVKTDLEFNKYNQERKRKNI